MKDREQNQAWIRNAVRAGSAVGTMFLSLVLAAGLWLILSKVWLKTPVPSVFGFSPVYVLSGSMEPTFSTGDMIIIHPQREYRPGDVVTFRSEGELVTHRIISESKEGFTVKGDANNVRDEEKVREQDIQGKLVLVVPHVGAIALFFRTRRGILLLAAVVLMAVVLTFRDRKREERKFPGGE